MNASALAAVAAASGQNDIVIIEHASSRPPQWIGWLIGGALLIGVAATTRRRSAVRRAGPPTRLTRIFAAAVTWSGVVTLMLAPDQLYDTPSALFPLTLLVRMVSLAAFAFTLFAVADLLLEHFYPRPSRVWLMVAPPLFTVFTLGFIIASGIGDSFGVFSEAGYMVPAAGAAGLTWWSWLPAPRNRLVQVFE